LTQAVFGWSPAERQPAQDSWAKALASRDSELRL